jgi:hypothetical protein
MDGSDGVLEVEGIILFFLVADLVMDVTHRVNCEDKWFYFQILKNFKILSKLISIPILVVDFVITTTHYPVNVFRFGRFFRACNTV